MFRPMIRRVLPPLLLFFCWIFLLEIEASELTWRPDKRVDAQIEGWPLDKVLRRVASSTGWQIYLEPGLNRTISAEFKNLPQGEALKLLLDEVNYALVPQAQGGHKLLVYQHSPGDATALVAGDRPKNWIPNEIILVVQEAEAGDVEKLAKELGAKITGRSEDLNAYRLTFEDAASAEAARRKLANLEGFEAQDNYSFERPNLNGGTATSPQSLFPVDPTPVTAGEQITIALLDTPIQPLDGKMAGFVLPSIHVTAAPAVLPETPTHATSMAQTILNSLAISGTPESNAGRVRVLPVDIYGDNASTTMFEVAQGLHRAIQANPNVINLSLGGEGESPLVEYLLKRAREKDILVFASAGNTPTTTPVWPAASPNVIGVTAASYHGEIAPYANRGHFVDVKAPGASRVYYRGQAYISTGTSTATAFISGHAAGFLARGLSPSASGNAILSNFDVNSTRVPGR